MGREQYRFRRVDTILPPQHPWRRFYENSPNSLERLAVELDLVAETYVRGIVSHSSYPTLQRLIRIQEKARKDMAAIAKTNNGNWVDLYQLKTRIDFLEPLSLLPAAFQLNDEATGSVRKHLAADLYGYSGEILSQALATYVAVRGNDFFDENIAKELRGVISEHTFLALTNKDGDPDRVALPGSIFDDKKRRIDGYYYRVDLQGPATKTPAQVKTTRFTELTEDGVAFVYMSDFQSPYHLEVSRAIAADISGTATDAQCDLICRTSQELLEYIQAESAIKGQPLAQE